MNPPERVSIIAERVDDFADRRYLVTVTLIVRADSTAQAITSVVSDLTDIT
jgi:hypothetical protein